MSPAHSSPVGLEAEPELWKRILFLGRQMWFTIIPCLLLKRVFQQPVLSPNVSVVSRLSLCSFNHSNKCIKCSSFKHLRIRRNTFLWQKWSNLIAVAALKQIKSMGTGSFYLWGRGGFELCKSPPSAWLECGAEPRVSLSPHWLHHCAWELHSGYSWC